MRVWIIALLLILLQTGSGICTPLSGTVQKEGYFSQAKSSQVVDNATGRPIANAVVSIPSKGITTRTDGNGRFFLEGEISQPAIMSIKADGYKPFSLTVNESTFRKPLVLGISKQALNEIVIDSNIHHLGDNNYSPSSANAGDFKTKSNGPKFSKRFYVKDIPSTGNPVIKIGSIIGLDTEMAKRLKQNRISYATSSPARLYINSQLIGEIKINGDNQEIPFPASLLNKNAYNEIVLETGKNLQQHKYVDYDDIEFMNLILEIR